MIDQIKIGNKSSFTDFEASVCQRKIGKPKKKSIRETVPFSNIVYDFSAINGEVYWEERDLEYVFEITADTPKQLEVKKQAFATWIMNVSEEELKDPFIDGYHFKATYSDITEEDDESVEKTTITVVFKAYPYMIADDLKVFEVSLLAYEDVVISINCESSHRIAPTFNSNIAFDVKTDDAIYKFNAGETMADTFRLKAGINTLTLQSVLNGTLIISFREEVF